MAVAFKDYYQILGVPRTATEDDVRKEYRKLARKHHPDVNPGNKSAEDRFKEMNEAYEVLSDAEKRRQYDQLGPNGNDGPRARSSPGRANGHVHFDEDGDPFAGTEGAAGFSDFFESMFAGRNDSRRGANFNMAGEDVNATIVLTLKEAHHGVVRAIQLAGAGAVRKSFEVKIPPGVRDGSVVRLAGQGEPGSQGATAGDLFLHITINPDRQFEVIGDDIQMELPVSPWEALLGGKVNVPTLDRQVEMTIPPHSQAGQRLRLKQQGLQKRAGGRGDEYVKLKVVLPTSPSAREKELFELLAAESRFNPRESPMEGK